MAVIQRVVKPTTRRGKRVLTNKEPKIIENTKQAIFIYGKRNSEFVRKCMKCLYKLKNPDAVFLNKKNDILPFEDISPIERICYKYDASLFMFSSHSKKRPNNMIIGRLYDGHLLDMFEFGFEPYVHLDVDDSFNPRVGIKPCLMFNGEDFDQIEHFSRFKSLIVDMFHHYEVTKTDLNALEYVMSFTIAGDKIVFRTYKVILDTTNKSKQPLVKLGIMEPSGDLTIRRKILASDDLFKKACQKPKTVGKKIKNIRRDVFGSKLGRVHMTSQSLDKLQTRKMKGLRNPEKKMKRKANNESDSVPEVKLSKLSIE